jgi:hypothetical protein
MKATSIYDYIILYYIYTSDFCILLASTSITSFHFLSPRFVILLAADDLASNLPHRPS